VPHPSVSRVGFLNFAFAVSNWFHSKSRPKIAALCRLSVTNPPVTSPSHIGCTSCPLNVRVLL
jgi:hypothetical protein